MGVLIHPQDIIFLFTMDTRSIDLQDLRQALKTARTPAERQMITHVANRVSNESKKIRSMREALINARRKGDTNEVKDINHFVRTHSEYQNER